VDEAYKNRLLKVLGQRIRELRSEKGYSQEAFADYCGVHRTFMGTVERGESNLSFQNIARVAMALGVTLSTLFLGLEDRAKKIDSPVRHSGDAKPKKRRFGH
jgi:transcriptional regulator with XRE-family HTH domain